MSDENIDEVSMLLGTVITMAMVAGLGAVAIHSAATMGPSTLLVSTPGLPSTGIFGAVAAPTNHLIIFDARLPGPSCRKIDLPKSSALNALIDSAAFTSKLSALDAAAAGEVELSIRLAEPAAGRVIDEKLRTPTNFALVNEVMGALRTVTPDSPQAFRLKLKYGKKTELKIEPSELCSPTSDDAPNVASNGQKLAFVVVGGSSSSGTGKPPPDARNTSGTSAGVRIRVNTMGRVSAIEFLTPPADEASDIQLRSQYLAAHYKPAKLDGEPVAVWMIGSKVELAK
jgi:hypothetical protein